MSPFNPLTPVSAHWHLQILLSNARRFYTSLGNPSGVKGLSEKPHKVLDEADSLAKRERERERERGERRSE